jgi:hypothetical protein
MRVQEPAKYAEPIIGSRPPRFVSVNYDHWFFYEKAGGPFTEGEVDVDEDRGVLDSRLIR